MINLVQDEKTEANGQFSAPRLSRSRRGSLFATVLQSSLESLPGGKVLQSARLVRTKAEAGGELLPSLVATETAGGERRAVLHQDWDLVAQIPFVDLAGKVAQDGREQGSLADAGRARDIHRGGTRTRRSRGRTLRCRIGCGEPALQEGEEDFALVGTFRER